MHPLLALLVLPLAILARPQGSESSGGAINSTDSDDTSLGDPKDEVIDCNPPDHSITPHTWECVKTMQQMPHTIAQQRFTKAARDLPRRFANPKSKCCVVADFVEGTPDNAEYHGSWVEFYIAGTQVLSACARTGGNAQELPRVGGMLKLGSDATVMVLMGKMPKSGKCNTNDMLEQVPGLAEAARLNHTQVEVSPGVWDYAYLANQTDGISRSLQQPGLNLSSYGSDFDVNVFAK